MPKERRSEGLLHTFNLPAIWKSGQQRAVHLRTTEIYMDFPYSIIPFQLRVDFFASSTNASTSTLQRIVMI